jgi:tetratricopeptide (TPR) repeat protein
MRAENYTAAVADIESALAAGGLSAQEAATLEHQLARLYVMQENYAAGIRILERALRAGPCAQLSHSTYYMLAALYDEQGRYEPALAVMEQRLESPFRDSSEMAAHYQGIVDLYVKMGRNDAARSTLEKMITLFSDRQSYRDQLHAINSMLGEAH